MRLAVRLFAAAVLVTSTLAARADTYQYMIVGELNPSVYTVVFDEPALLQGDATITSFISSSPSVISVEINPTSDDCANTSGPGACVEFDLTNGEIADNYVGPLNTIGTFTINSGTADEVIITDLGPSTSPVPEPSTLALFGTGLIGAAGTLRRRFLPS